jgi:cell division septation protein DedD
MARDDGEFELILGNKQLLSVLFIIIVLLGVFFAMGFLAGRSTGPKEISSAKGAAAQAPLMVEPGGSEPAAIQPAKPAPASEPAGPPPQDDIKRIEPAAPEAVKPEPPKKEPPKETVSAKPPLATPPAKSVQPPVFPPAKPASTPVSGGGFVAAPPSGSYLQVAATRRPEAEALLGMLKGKGCGPGYVTPSPKAEGMMRVVLGPLGEASAIAERRECVKKVGLESTVVVKY